MNYHGCGNGGVLCLGCFYGKQDNDNNTQTSEANGYADSLLALRATGGEIIGGVAAGIGRGCGGGERLASGGCAFSSLESGWACGTTN